MATELVTQKFDLGPMGPIIAAKEGGRRSAPKLHTYTFLEIQTKLQQFFQFVQDGMGFVRAARECGHSYPFFERLKEMFPEVKERWELLWKLKVRVLEDSMMDRAINGYEEPIYQNGTLVGTRTVHSPHLGIFMLSRLNQDQYGDKIQVAIEPMKIAAAIRAHIEEADGRAMKVIESAPDQPGSEPA